MRLMFLARRAGPQVGVVGHGAVAGEGGEDFTGDGTFEHPIDGLGAPAFGQVGVSVGAGALIVGHSVLEMWCKVALACRSPPRESR